MLLVSFAAMFPTEVGVGSEDVKKLVTVEGVSSVMVAAPPPRVMEVIPCVPCVAVVWVDDTGETVLLPSLAVATLAEATV